MSDLTHSPDSPSAFTRELVARGLFLPCGAPGVYGYNRVFEDVLAGFDRLVSDGEPGQALEWRNLWRERAVHLLRGLQLSAEAVPASDPFFGRGGRLLASTQLEHGFKFEVVVPVDCEAQPTAVASFNYHQD